MSDSDDPREAVVALEASADRALVERWFAERGFGVTPMAQALLVDGDTARFVAHLGLAPGADLQERRELAVPASLSPHVAEIVLYGVPRR